MQGSAICKILVSQLLVSRNKEGFGNGKVPRNLTALMGEGLVRGFEQTLLGFFLALDAVPRPRHSFQALGVNLFAAGNAFAKAAFPNSRQRSFDHVEKLPIVVALAEEKFLRVRAGCSIGNVLRGFFIGCAAVLLIARHHVPQFLLPHFQPFLKGFEFLFIHNICLS
jgi:hypothetical protein